MEVGLIGLPGSGKSTVFDALTGQAGGAGIGPRVGVADIPDRRLNDIAAFYEPKRIVHDVIRMVDIPGVPAGVGAAKLNKFFEHVRQVDAVCHVVRCFSAGGSMPTNPAADIESMDTELVLADLQVAESAHDKAVRTARTGDADAKTRATVLERVVEALGEGKPLRTISDWSENERGILRSYGMITDKPVLYVANIDEEHLGDESISAPLVQYAQATGGEAVALCGLLEAELAELADEDRQEMLEGLGLQERAIGQLARAANRLLGLTSFYTASEKEVRAWSVRTGATAPQAAGSVHSDMERGFIRAECYHFNDLVELKTEKAIKSAGKMRSEGKDYLINDGDVVHFLFNV
jgi:hypothetical protein